MTKTLLPFLMVVVLLGNACKKATEETVILEPTLEHTSGMSMASISNSATYISYWIYTPKNATANMPLVVYLHGGSGRGNNLNLVIDGSLPKFLIDGSIKDVPAYIVMPQCPANTTWESFAPTVKELIDFMVVNKKISPKKISLTGHSLGGSGTWSLAASYPNTFSCIAPLSGSVSASKASAYVGFPVWAFVGSADTVVDPASSQNIVPLINTAGGNAQLKVYAGASHFEVADLAYKDQNLKLLDWLIGKSRN